MGVWVNPDPGCAPVYWNGGGTDIPADASTITVLGSPEGWGFRSPPGTWPSGDLWPGSGVDRVVGASTPNLAPVGALPASHVSVHVPSGFDEWTLAEVTYDIQFEDGGELYSRLRWPRFWEETTVFVSGDAGVTVGQGCVQDYSTDQREFADRDVLQCHVTVHAANGSALFHREWTYNEWVVLLDDAGLTGSSGVYVRVTGPGYDGTGGGAPTGPATVRVELVDEATPYWEAGWPVCEVTDPGVPTGDGARLRLWVPSPGWDSVPGSAFYLDDVTRSWSQHWDVRQAGSREGTVVPGPPGVSVPWLRMVQRDDRYRARQVSSLQVSPRVGSSGAYR